MWHDRQTVPCIRLPMQREAVALNFTPKRLSLHGQESPRNIINTSMSAISSSLASQSPHHTDPIQQHVPALIEAEPAADHACCSDQHPGHRQPFHLQLEAIQWTRRPKVFRMALVVYCLPRLRTFLQLRRCYCGQYCSQGR